MNLEFGLVLQGQLKVDPDKVREKGTGLPSQSSVRNG
jgi:hypothetical protein